MPAAGIPAPSHSAAAPAHGALGAARDLLNFNLTGFAGFKLTLGSLLIAVVVIILAAVVSRVLQAGLARYAQRHPSNQATMYALSRVLHYVVLAIGVLWGLQVAGIPLSEFTLFAGALGVGIGFGLQAIFSNFISGLILLFDRSLKIGDFVQLEGNIHGEVREIAIRYTRVTTTDNIDILVPNAKFITGNVVNLTLRDTARRTHIAFRVPYGTDKETVRQAALEAAAEVPFTLTGDPSREAQVWLTAFGESALEFALVVWLNAGASKRYRGVIAAYNWALHNALVKHDLKLPYPQRDLHVKSWPRSPAAPVPVATAGHADAAAGTAAPRSRNMAARASNDAARSVSADIARDASDARDASREARARTSGPDTGAPSAATPPNHGTDRTPDHEQDR